MTLHRAIKHAAEFTLCALGVTRLRRRRHASDTIILAYHNIVPTGEAVAGDLSLHLPQENFARHLELLGRTHEVIALTELSRPTDRRPRAVITFDDAYTGALTAGVDELRQRNMPATVFVAPAFIGGGSFWWDVLSDLQGELRDHALNQLAGRDHEVRAWAALRGMTQLKPPAHQCAARESDLLAAQATGLITFGSHSWTHPNLSALDPGELKAELMRPMEWLQSRFSATIPWLAYPYGLANAQVEQAASECGFEGAVTVDAGWLSSASATPFALPRLNVPAGISVRGFELRTSGVK